MNKNILIILLAAVVFVLLTPFVLSKIPNITNHSYTVVADDSLQPGDGTGDGEDNTNGSDDSGSPTDNDNNSGAADGSTVPNLDPGKINAPDLPGGSTDEWTDLVKNFISWLLIAAGIITVVCIIFAGYIYMTSGGDPEKAKIGKSAVVGSIIGLVIVFIAYAIISFVSGSLLSGSGGGGSGGGSGGSGGGPPQSKSINCEETCPEDVDYCTCGTTLAPCVKDTVQPGESCGLEAHVCDPSNPNCQEGQNCTEIPPGNNDWYCVEW